MRGMQHKSKLIEEAEEKPNLTKCMTVLWNTWFNLKRTPLCIVVNSEGDVQVYVMKKAEKFAVLVVNTWRWGTQCEQALMQKVAVNSFTNRTSWVWTSICCTWFSFRQLAWTRSGLCRHSPLPGVARVWGAAGTGRRGSSWQVHRAVGGGLPVEEEGS